MAHKNMVLSIISRKLYIVDNEIKLTAKEFDLLQLLMTRPGHVFTYRQVFDYVWGGSEAYGAKEIVWACMHRLRDKLSIDPVVLNYIKTVRDIGYCFEPK
jgi:DNA-binding response OmpR family regulator